MAVRRSVSDWVKNHWVKNQQDGTGAASPLYARWQTSTIAGSMSVSWSGSTGRRTKHLYIQRHLVACCFSELKQFRRVATHFEKTARNCRASSRSQPSS